MESDENGISLKEHCVTGWESSIDIGKCSDGADSHSKERSSVVCGERLSFSVIEGEDPRCTESYEHVSNCSKEEETSAQ